MIDKELLEDIKKLREMILEESDFRIRCILANVFVSLGYMDYLFKQAERVHELEQQNKRYKQALEFYANEETYEMKFPTDTDEICVPLTIIELDEGKKAREALEGNLE